MLDAYIIDQLKKAEEESWEHSYPVVEVPTVDVEEIPSDTPSEKKYIWTIDFN